jgi:hypothetical protein
MTRSASRRMSSGWWVMKSIVLFVSLRSSVRSFAISARMAGSRHALPLAARKRARQAPLIAAEADARERGEHALSRRRIQPQRWIDTEADIVGNRQVREKIVVLEDDRDRPFRGIPLCHGFAEQPDIA